MDYQNNYNDSTYDTSSNAYEGGGYMNSPNRMDTDSTSKNQSSGQKKFGNQTVTPVTIKLFHSSHLNTQGENDSAWTLFNKEIHYLSIVAKVVAIANSAAANAISFVVDDGTGRADIKVWGDKGDNEGTSLEQKRLLIQEGAYLRIYGQPRASPNSKRSITVFSLAPVEDHNELSYHFLESIAVYLAHTKGTFPLVGGNVNAVHNAYSTTSHQTSNTNTYNTWDSYNTAAPIQGNLKQAIIDLIASVNTLEGVSVSYIASQLGKSEGEIRKMISFLVEEEGLLYSTTDDDHYQVAR